MTDQEPVKHQIRKSLESLTTLRDEIRVQLHLANMDVKTAWSKLEPEVEEANKMAEDATAISQKAIEDIIGKFRTFRDEHLLAKK
jgi:hypothetical protein